MKRIAIAAAAIMTAVSTPAMAQIVVYAPRPQRPPVVQVQLPAPQLPRLGPDETSLSGPRFGVTILSPGTVEALRVDRGITVQPIVSQFGWQFEHSFNVNPDGLAVLTEFVPLLSGLEQGLALPSLNMMVGIRTGAGTEFGLGPNITPVGVGLVLAGGVTVKTGSLNVPLTFAFASSKYGPRISIMTGFSIRRR
jgi:hypothetical protein